MMLSGAKIVVETLIEQGCDTVFGYPGGQVINLFDELYVNRNRIRHVLTAHEQGCANLYTLMFLAFLKAFSRLDISNVL